ncbi:hypothetical protein ACFWGN_11935 [Oerskovia sp. NPDC060338]|uniref:hypothetical protein n=1 Tax=Oerskovia sp. NPDC060338 TaxID=3347100 RepID=UPI003662C3C2
MNDHDESLHPRATDGKFATKAVTEADGGMSALATAAPEVPLVSAMTEKFGPVSVVDAPSGYACGSNADRAVQIATEPDEIGTVVEANLLMSGESVVEATVTASWPLPADQRAVSEWESNAVRIYLPHPGSPQDLTDALDQIGDRAQIQRALDTEFTLPQARHQAEQATKHTGRPVRVDDTMLVTLNDGGATPRVEFRAPHGRGTATLCFERSTGRVTGGTVSTAFGQVSLADDQSLTQVASRVTSEIRGGSGATWEGTREELEQRMATVFGVAR